MEWWLAQSGTMDQMTSDSLYIDGIAQKRCDGLCGTICPDSKYYGVP